MRTKLVVLAAALALALASGLAIADTLTLSDGTRLEGSVVEQRADEIVFEHTLGGAKVRSTFKKSQVKSLEFGSTGKTDAKPSDAPPPAGYDELKTYKHGVVIVLDRSGSMAIEGRFEAALAQVDEIIAGLNATTGFGVYLFDTRPVSVFDSNSVKKTEPARGRLRKRIQELGGLDRSAFTDLAAALVPAIRARPDAIYLVTDGVPTRGELEGRAIVKAIRDVMPSKKFPIHVVALRSGNYRDGVEENDEGAREILKAIADATGGKLRVVESKAKRVGALKADPNAPDYESTLHCYSRNHEFTERELRFPSFEVEVRDDLFASGLAVMEYASVGFDVRTRTDAGVPFDEVKNLALTWREPDAEKKTVMGLGGTFAAGGKSFWTPPIKVVRPQDAREGAEGTVFVKVPSDGGTLEIVYRRGKHSWNKVFIVKPAQLEPTK